MPAFPELHDHKIEKTPEGSRYPFIVICSCQWQSFAPSEDMAEHLFQRHQYARELRATSGGVSIGRRP